VHYRLHCEEEQLTSLLRDKDAPYGDWLVFFSVTDFRKPSLSVYADFIDAADVEILLEENDAVIATGRLKEIEKID
jgi:hypothetical protein